MCAVRILHPRKFDNCYNGWVVLSLENAATEGSSIKFKEELEARGRMSGSGSDAQDADMSNASSGDSAGDGSFSEAAAAGSSRQTAAEHSSRDRHQKAILRALAHT